MGLGLGRGYVAGVSVEGFASFAVEDLAHSLGVGPVAFEVPVCEVDSSYCGIFGLEGQFDL
jgi:hypothetical protein